MTDTDPPDSLTDPPSRRRSSPSDARDERESAPAASAAESGAARRPPIGASPIGGPPGGPGQGGGFRPKARSHSMADMLIGTVLADRYKLLTRIGEGAMGWVFIGEHVEIGKKVAVKVLRPSLCRMPEAVSRFRREARAATQIGSRHIVDVTDFGTTDTGAAFFVMEHLDGEDLSTTLKKEKFLGWERVVHILQQLCEALQAAHDSGIIHRDVKPANFYRVQQGGDPDFIKILDFGIARLANPQDSIVTQTGVVMGTPDFMAPEQAMGKHVDHRADVYSLGASAYALLTGRPPFEGANEYDVIYKQLNDHPDPPSAVAPVAAGAPTWLDPIILKALRKEPDERFASMAEFGEAVRKAADKATAEASAAEEVADEDSQSEDRPPSSTARLRSRLMARNRIAEESMVGTTPPPSRVGFWIGVVMAAAVVAAIAYMLAMR